MAQFIVFYQILPGGNIDTCIGGDSEIKCDGRYSFRTIIEKVFNKEYYIPKEAIGFKIHCGTNHLNHKPHTKLYTFENFRNTPIKYLYVFDYSQNQIFEIELDDTDRSYINDVCFILKRRGLRYSQCTYMFSNNKNEISEIKIS